MTAVAVAKFGWKDGEFPRLYSTLSLTKLEIIQLTHRLCGLYMTFPGMVSW